MKKCLIGCVLLLALAACAVTESESENPPVTAKEKEMTFDEAKQLVASFEARQARKTGSHPLRSPGTVDDVFEILKLDQLDLFAHGTSFAARQGEDMKAVGLRAQIELAWGEAQTILADVLNDTAAHLRAAARAIESRATDEEPLDKASQAKLDELKKQIAETTATAEALTILSTEHYAKGAKFAKTIIAKSPNDYHGYRVVADYYRLGQEWKKFDFMVKKIEETNPNSNGLVFLRGVAAAYREGDSPKAAEFFKKALANDPKFIRAQAHLFLLQRGIDNIYAEYRKLKTLNPNHQIVVWAGPYIENAHAQLSGTPAEAEPPKAPEKPKEPEKAKEPEKKEPEKAKEPEKKEEKKEEKKDTQSGAGEKKEEKKDPPKK